MLSPQSFDLAQDAVRERLRRAAHDALVQQAKAAATSPSTSRLARLWIANGLRAMAVRLDPSICCEPSLAVVPFPR
jgi:hypothetical protein